MATSNDTPWGDDAVSAESPYARDKGLQSHVKYGVSRRQSHSKPDVSRRVSLEPPQTFAEGQHIGPSAGVSFLYHGWTRGTTTAEEETCLPAAPLTCHGDIPQAPVDKNQPLPTTEEARALIERYFQFATPTYRFLHRPTVEEWMARLLQGGRLSTSEAACVLIVFSQALLYTTVGDRYQDGGDEGLNRSRACKFCIVFLHNNSIFLQWQCITSDYKGQILTGLNLYSTKNPVREPCSASRLVWPCVCTC